MTIMQSIIQKKWKIFNEVIPKTIYSLKETTKYEINVIHQTGKTIKTATDQYRNIDVNIDIREYIDPMINVYEWCDIIICRGGAITLHMVQINTLLFHLLSTYCNFSKIYFLLDFL